MPITFAAEPMIVDEARSYAKHNGMTLEVLMLSYLESIAARERERRENKAREMFDYLMAQKGSLAAGYKFNREEANARG